MSDNGCYFIKCPYWNGKICTDTDEFFNKSGDMVCRFNGDAVRKTEVEKLRDEVAALRAELAEKEKQVENLNNIIKRGCEDEDSQCPQLERAEKAEQTIKELQEKLSEK